MLESTTTHVAQTTTTVGITQDVGIQTLFYGGISVIQLQANVAGVSTDEVLQAHRDLGSVVGIQSIVDHIDVLHQAVQKKGAS